MTNIEEITATNNARMRAIWGRQAYYCVARLSAGEREAARECISTEDVSDRERALMLVVLARKHSAGTGWRLSHAEAVNVATEMVDVLRYS